MRQNIKNLCIFIFRNLQLERSWFFLLWPELPGDADITTDYPLACPNKYLLSPIYSVEHLVSEIQGQTLVHPLCLCADVIMATVYMLFAREMDGARLPPEI